VGEVATALVAWLVLYTYPVAALTVLVAALGVPLPSTMLVLAAGSITTTAEDAPDFWLLFGIIVVAAVIGDIASYSLGRWAGHLVVGHWGGRIGVTPARLGAVERNLERWGGLLVVMTRCVLTGLAVPTNLVAGASSYPLVRFAAFALVGEAIWAGGFLTLGWYFGASWVALLDYVDDAATALTMLAVAVVLIVMLVRLLRPAPEMAKPE
jgi:membrane-associated protein